MKLLSIFALWFVILSHNAISMDLAKESSENPSLIINVAADDGAADPQPNRFLKGKMKPINWHVPDDRAQLIPNDQDDIPRKQNCVSDYLECMGKGCVITASLTEILECVCSGGAIITEALFLGGVGGTYFQIANVILSAGDLGFKYYTKSATKGAESYHQNAVLLARNEFENEVIAVDSENRLRMLHHLPPLFADENETEGDSDQPYNLKKGKTNPYNWHLTSDDKRASLEKVDDDVPRKKNCVSDCLRFCSLMSLVTAPVSDILDSICTGGAIITGSLFLGGVGGKGVNVVNTLFNAAATGLKFYTKAATRGVERFNNMAVSHERQAFNDEVVGVNSAKKLRELHELQPIQVIENNVV